MLACLAVVLGLVPFALSGAAAEPDTNSQVLVDFEQADGLRMYTAQAAAARVKVGSGQALEITTEAMASFPSVYLQRPEGSHWDLTGFDAVRVDVENPEDVPLRVLLSLNAPGADGRKNCNVESIRLGARERGTLTVPFGVWHGQKNHPIDQARIVSLQVLLDRPGRGHRFLVDNLRAIRFEKFELAKAETDPFFRQLRPFCGRGINLGNALDAPREGEWGVKLEEEFFETIKAAGFDSIRLPVRWSAHAEAAAPYRIDPPFLRRVDWAVEQALARGLSVVLNMHHYEEMDSQPDAHRERFLALWEQIAAHYQGQPPALAFELLNEPHDQLTAAKWNALLAEAVGVVRRTNPARQIVVGPVQWNSIGALETLALPEADRNLVVTVHYYSPFEFTHQGASWVGPKSNDWLGTKWLGTKEEQEAVLKDLDAAILWGLKHRRPIYLGEFGAFEKADLESRVRWTKFVADEAARRKIGSAYWEFCAGFGAYDRAQRAWIVPLRDALLGERN